MSPKGSAARKYPIVAMPVWIKEKLFQKTLLRNRLREHAPDFDWASKLPFTEHHQSHAASAFYPSPFEAAVVLTMDGVGEWATTSVGEGVGNRIEMMKEIHFPHSLGLLYSAFTYYTGFKVNSGEYKVMGLAPYGEPKYAATILDNLIDLSKGNVSSCGKRWVEIPGCPAVDQVAYDIGFMGSNQRKVGPQSCFQ